MRLAAALLESIAQVDSWEDTDKVTMKCHFLGTNPAGSVLSSLGPLWIIARCHWVKLTSINHLHRICCFQLVSMQRHTVFPKL